MRQHMAMVAVLLLGCGDGSPTGPKEEFRDCLDQLIDMENPQRELRITGLFQSLGGLGTRSLRIAELGDIIRLTESFIADLQSVRINDPELRTIHGKYVRGWQAFLVGYRLMELGMREDRLELVGPMALESAIEGRMLVDEYMTGILLYAESIGYDP